MPTTRTLLTTGLAIGGVAAAGGLAVWGSTRDAPAQASSLALAAQQHLANVDRVFWYSSTRVYSPGHAGSDKWGRVTFAMRTDLPNRRLAIDGVGGGWRYVHDAGDLTHHRSGLRDRPPLDLDVFEPMVDDLLAELDAGLANSTWVQETPPSVERGPLTSRYHDLAEWWRVDLPTAADDTLRIYLLLQNLDPDVCMFAHVVVLHEDVDEIVRVHHPHARYTYDLSADLCQRVQWNPDWSTSDLKPPFSDRMYRWRSIDTYEYGEYGKMP